MTRLDGKIALITGGTNGMGAATVAAFVAEGATVVATGSGDASVEAARAQVPGVDFLVSDASDPGAAKALVEHVRAEHGRLDVLFVNAGICRIAAIETVEEALFDELFDINVRGPYFLLKHAVPLIADGGSIIFTASTSAIRGASESSAYGATKGAIRALALHLAIELAPRRIRVNTISPGPIATNISASMNLTPEQIAGFGDVIGQIPLGRIGAAEDVAPAALFFASDESRFTTGAEVVIDGGRSNRF